MSAPTCTCGECRKCKHRAYMREWSARNREAKRELDRSYYARNADKVRERVKRYRVENVDALRAYDRERGHRVYDEAKERARRAFGKAVERGKILRQPCEVCGKPNAEGHHADYSKPYAVRWLCRRHHMEIHRRVAA